MALLNSELHCSLRCFHPIFPSLTWTQAGMVLWWFSKSLPAPSPFSLRGISSKKFSASSSCFVFCFLEDTPHDVLPPPHHRRPPQPVVFHLLPFLHSPFHLLPENSLSGKRIWYQLFFFGLLLVIVAYWSISICRVQDFVPEETSDSQKSFWVPGRFGPVGGCLTAFK